MIREILESNGIEGKGRDAIAKQLADWISGEISAERFDASYGETRDRLEHLRSRLLSGEGREVFRPWRGPTPGGAA